MMTIADLLLKAADILFKRRDQYEAIARGRADRVADWFAEASKALLAAANQLEAGLAADKEVSEVAGYFCGFNLVFAQIRDSLRTDTQMPDLFGMLEDALYADYSVGIALQHSRRALLLDATKKVDLSRYRRMKDPSSRQIQAELCKIRRAAGHFQAMATTIRALSP
jgi:hypothetical protein